MRAKETELKKLKDGLLSYFWFFRRPKIEEIKSGRSGKFVTRNLVNEIERMGPDEYIVTKPIDIGSRFLKKGKIFKIKLPKTKTEFFSKKITSSTISKQIEGRKTKDAYRGYGWRCISDKTMRLIPLNSILAGFEVLYFFAPEIYKNSENENAKRLYSYLSEIPVKISSEDYGNHSILYVPSRTEGKVYNFKIENIPINDKYYTWTKTKPVGHNCGFYLYFSLSNYSNGIILWCPHTVGGYEYILWKSQKGKRDKILSNPFIIPTEEDMNFYDNLRRVIVEDDGNRPLNVSEKEALLWKYFIGRKRKKNSPLSSYVIKVV